MWPPMNCESYGNAAFHYDARKTTKQKKDKPATNSSVAQNSKLLPYRIWSNDAICLTDSFVFTLGHCVNF